MLVVAECVANCVIVSVVISHGSQCQLLKYYLDGIMNRLEEKSTELRYIMKVFIQTMGERKQEYYVFIL